MTVLNEIEAKFGFKYPAIYHQMYADGMLNFGEPAADWESKVPQLFATPPLLFFAKDFELMLPELVMEMRDEFYAHVSYRAVPEGMSLIPFGTTGGGDMYCFDITDVQTEDLPIVLAAHDSSHVEVLTTNFQDFVYQGLLAMVTDVEPDDAVMHGDFTTNVRNMLKTHERYLTDKQREELQQAALQ